MRVWITRAEPGASATAAALRARGHDPLTDPLLRIAPVDAPAGAMQASALAFTSANAVRAFAGWSGRRDLPVFAVGDATAAAAREAGFDRVRSAGGDVAALARLLQESGIAGEVLHPCAEERAGDLVGEAGRGGVRVRPLVLYRSLALQRLPDGVEAALQARELPAVLVHSPKAGRALAQALASTPPAVLAALAAYGLSAACLAPLASLGLAALHVAERPDEAALLERLG